jgi:Sensors of blue-light using FAD
MLDGKVERWGECPIVRRNTTGYGCGLYTVVYISTEVLRFSNSDLENLLQQSRRDNSVSEITGLLLYKDGNFMQLLEGSETAVVSTLAKIKRDPRHRALVVVMQEETPHREFENWSMAFGNLGSETSPAEPGYSDFLDLPLNSEKFQADPSKAFGFLLAFKKSML